MAKERANIRRRRSSFLLTFVQSHGEKPTMRHESLLVLLFSLIGIGCTTSTSSTSTGGPANSAAPTKDFTASPAASTSVSASVAAALPSAPNTNCKKTLPAGQAVDAKAINSLVLPGYDPTTNTVATVPAPKNDKGAKYGVQPCRGELFLTDAFYDTFKKGDVKTVSIPGTDWASGMFLAWIKVGELPGMDEVSVGFRALVKAKDGFVTVEALGLFESTSWNDMHGEFHHVGENRYALERKSNSGEEATLENEEQVWLVKDGSWVDTGTFLQKYEETRNFPLEKIKRSMTAQIEANAEGFVLHETWTFSPAEGNAGKTTTKKLDRKAVYQGDKWVFTPPKDDFPKP